MITGSGQLVLSSLLTVELLNNTNDFTGLLFVQTGRVRVAALANSGASSPIGAGDSIWINGLLAITGDANSASNRAVRMMESGQIETTVSGVTHLLEGEITGDTLLKRGDGILALTNPANSFRDVLIIQGTLSTTGFGNATGTSPLGAGFIRLGNAGSSGELELTQTGTAASNRTIAVVGDGGTLRITSIGTTALTLSGAVSGQGPLTFAADSATDTIILTGAGAGRTGSTTLDQVHLILNAAPGEDALPIQQVTLRDNVASQLEVTSSESIGSLAGGAGTTNFGRLTLGNSLGVGGDNLSTTFDGLIEGAGLLIKRGTGTWTLTRANSFTGGLTVENGAVALASLSDSGIPSPLGMSGQITLGAVISDGTLRYTGASAATSNRPFSMAAGGGTFQIADPAAIVTLTGGLSGAGTLTKTGSGALNVTNAANSFAGVAIAEGKLLTAGLGNAAGTSPLGRGAIVLGGASTNGELGLMQSGAVSSNRNIAIGSGGGTFRIDSIGTTTTLTLSGTMTGSGPLTFAADSLNDTIALTGIGSGRTGSTTLDGIHLILNTNGGDALPLQRVTLRDGVANQLEITSSESIGSLAGGAGITNFGRVTLNNDLGVGSDNSSTTFDGLIEGMGGLIKRGTGTLTLTRANPFTGGLTVENGTLALRGSLAGSTVIVPTGSTLATIDAPTLRRLTLDGGVLDIQDLGSGAGQPVFLGSLLEPGLELKGGMIRFDIAGNVPGTSYDQVVVSHLRFGAAPLDLDLQLGFDPVDDIDVFTLFDVMLAFSPNASFRFAYQGVALENRDRFFVTTGPFSQLFEMRYGVAPDFDVQLLAVPEAGSAVFLLLGATAFGFRRRGRSSGDQRNL
jgi:autotransporter-associated beta strand protein